MVTSAIEQEGNRPPSQTLRLRWLGRAAIPYWSTSTFGSRLSLSFSTLRADSGMTDVALGHATLAEAMVPIVIPNDGAMPLPRDNGNGAGS